jgi:hypothetical protein
MFHEPKNLPDRLRHKDIVLAPQRARSEQMSYQLMHYMGKHCKHPQKSLWSADTPLPQDRYHFKLTTLDVDAFKYWFGVKRAFVKKDVWKLLWRAGLLPPTFYQHNTLLTRPIFDKEDLYQYYLQNRPDAEVEKQANYYQYLNGITITESEAEARRPKAPYF